jgi:hypothetical protein
MLPEGPLSFPVLASVAAYLRDGQPLSAQRGAYVEIARITDNLAQTIADRLAAHWGERPLLIVGHDGTAAALAHAEDTHTAVITIGTALGIGFPPATSDGLRSPHRDFSRNINRGEPTCPPWAGT